jgi:hypothetical protein
MHKKKCFSWSPAVEYVGIFPDITAGGVIDMERRL